MKCGLRKADCGIAAVLSRISARTLPGFELFSGSAFPQFRNPHFAFHLFRSYLAWFQTLIAIRNSPIPKSEIRMSHFAFLYCKSFAKTFSLGFSSIMRICVPLAVLVLWLFPVLDCHARMAILTTFAPVDCFTSNVAGDAADVSVLVPPNAGPHDYSFSPADVQKIAKADVLVMNGAGLESWLQRGIRSAGKKNLLVVDTSAGIKLITGLDVRPLPGVHSEPDPDAGGPNPHIWLSPINAIKQVENIRDALASRDPANAETYRANADAYIRRLNNLDAQIRRATASFPNKNLITFHDTFPYFARDYGFHVVATFEEFPGQEPSPRTIEQLRKIIAAGNVSALFSEPQYSPKAMQIIGKEFKVPVVQLDPMETGDGSKDFYERVTQKNLDALVAAFHGGR
jgi:zinc transport system substrate-binding protein